MAPATVVLTPIVVLVCTACEEKGCSNRDAKLYRCQGTCGLHLGHMKFEGKQLNNYKTLGQKMLICNVCKENETKNKKQNAPAFEEKQAARMHMQEA